MVIIVIIIVVVITVTIMIGTTVISDIVVCAQFRGMDWFSLPFAWFSFFGKPFAYFLCEMLRCTKLLNDALFVFNTGVFNVFAVVSERFLMLLVGDIREQP